MASLGVEPKRRSQEQGESLDLRLAPKDTPSGLNILSMSPPMCVKGGNNFQGVIIDPTHISHATSAIRGHLERFGTILSHLEGFDANLAILGFFLTIGFQIHSKYL